MILIAYDRTRDANHAIAVAGALMRGRYAHIVHVWQPLSPPGQGVAIAGAAPLPGQVLEDEIELEESRARGVADAGVDLARAAGFDADGEAVRGDGASAADTLEQEIDRLRPELVVIGSRGLTGLKAMVKGSASHHVGAHAHAPVLIVSPAPDA